ncbi:hypothetical protein T484DRAFT_2019469 [Baffinella frigidus]|nr:hypothetical protein T484DRAFT_2019469 [Cryptophyta sp. CCMP2293]
MEGTSGSPSHRSADESMDFMPNPQCVEDAAATTVGSGWSALAPGPAWSEPWVLSALPRSRKPDSSSEGRRHRRDAAAPYIRPSRQVKESSNSCVGHAEGQVADMREKAAREKARVLLLPSGVYKRNRLRELEQMFKLLDEKAPRDEVSQLMKSLQL